MPASTRAVSFALAGCELASPAEATMTAVATSANARMAFINGEIMIRIAVRSRRAPGWPSRLSRFLWHFTYRQPWLNETSQIGTTCDRFYLKANHQLNSSPPPASHVQRRVAPEDRKAWRCRGIQFGESFVTILNAYPVHHSISVTLIAT